jgi:hypothetical protein
MKPHVAAPEVAFLEWAAKMHGDKHLDRAVFSAGDLRQAYLAGFRTGMIHVKQAALDVGTQAHDLRLYIEKKIRNLEHSEAQLLDAIHDASDGKKDS